MKANQISLVVLAAAAVVLIGLFVWHLTRTEAEQAERVAQAARGYPASCDDPAAAITISSLHPMTPDWVQLAPNARDAGGGWTYWGKRTVRRCGENEAQITVQTRYAREQLYGEAGAGYQQIIRYTLARTRYRINCDDETYAIIDRQIVGPDDEIIAVEPGAPEDFKPRTLASPVGGDLMNTACNGA